MDLRLAASCYLGFTSPLECRPSHNDVTDVDRCVLYPLELEFRAWERYEGPYKAYLREREAEAEKGNACAK